MFKITHSKRFKKDFRKLAHSGAFELKPFKRVVNQLAAGLVLSPKYKDHPLKGDLNEFRECHLEPDLLLIYSKEADVLILHLFRIGSHNELFE